MLVAAGPVTGYDSIFLTGCSSAWLERLLWEQEVARSNRVTPTFLFELGSMVVEFFIAG